jgi:transcriptional regulator with XRE-family HTH domain
LTINERVKMVRKELGLNQTDFGKRIAIAQGYLTNVENGRRDVTEKTIRLICLEFNVSENWLRTGEGEMFIESDSTIVSQLSSEYGLDAFEKAMINGFLKMKPEQRAMLKEWVKSAMCEVFDNEQAYKEFREEYDKGRALPFAARGGDTSGLAEAAERFNSTFPAAENKDGM